MLTHPKAPRRRLLPAIAAAVTLVVAAALPARADVTGDYDGQLTGKTGTASLAVVLTQSGTSLLGQGDLVSGDAALDGIYVFSGKATGKKKIKVKLTGSGSTVPGAKVTFQGKLSGTTIAGKVKVKSGSSKLNGKLTLSFNVPKDGTPCDAVYTQNKDFFDLMVMPIMTGICGPACHEPSGVSASARFKVTAGDNAATARTTVQEVDVTNPDASRLVQKPLHLIAHGGAPARFAVGGPEDTALRQWAGLIASAHCAP
jgi:hypothetical protein